MSSRDCATDVDNLKYRTDSLNMLWSSLQKPTFEVGSILGRIESPELIHRFNDNPFCCTHKYTDCARIDCACTLFT